MGIFGFNSWNGPGQVVNGYGGGTGWVAARTGRVSLLRLPSHSDHGCHEVTKTEDFKSSEMVGVAIRLVVRVPCAWPDR